MTLIKFSRIVDVSSEDPKYPANNLLKSEVTGCWKCKNVGEKQAIVIIEFEKSCIINSIDVENECTAFIEILVGKSELPDVFEVLRVSSSLMSVSESKSEKNKNGVRIFKHEDFEKSAVNESWDRLKVICSQPFNKSVQYGLRFIKVHVKSQNLETKNETAALGKFNFKKEDNSDIVIGSLFAQRKNVLSSISTAVGNKDAAKDIKTLEKLSLGSKKLSDLLPKKDTKKIHKNGDMSNQKLSFNVSIENTENSQKNENNDLSNITKLDRKRKMNSNFMSSEHKPKNSRFKDTNSSSLNNSPKLKQKPIIDSPSNKNSEQIIEKEVKRKPFNRLLEDVVFVISGYQNPLRADLRSKALQMGAKYKADWDISCTHLICAFSNTPKFNQVLNKGWIVSKNWIEECFKQKKRLLSSDFKLNKNDIFTHPNDEEIWMKTSTSDTDEKNFSGRMERKSVTHSPKKTETIDNTQNINDSSVYDIDTDIDSDTASNKKIFEDICLTVLPDFFNNMKFYLGADLQKCTADILTRYITAYKGKINEDVDTVTFIVTEDSRYKENITNTPVVLPDWIWECSDKKKLIPYNYYLL